MTLAEAMTLGGQAVPDYSVPIEWKYIIDAFWKLKRFLGEISDPIHPSLVKDWCECQDVYLTKRDRELIYVLDHSVRSALSKQRAENDRYFANRRPKR